MAIIIIDNTSQFLSSIPQLLSLRRVVRVILADVHDMVGAPPCNGTPKQGVQQFQLILFLSERRCRHVSGNSYVSGGATCLRYDHGDRIVFSGKSLALLSQTLERTRVSSVA